MQLLYLGFQRAPPRFAVSGATIQVAPLICNDLRDEVYEPGLDAGNVGGHVRLVLAWVVTAANGGQKRLHEGIQTLQWTGAASAYRPVSITVPASDTLRNAASLQVAVYVDEPEGAFAQETTPWTYCLETGGHVSRDGEEAGPARFIPCLSESVKIVSGQEAVDASQKSGGLVRRFALGKDKSKVVSIEEHAGYALDKHIWDASLHFGSWLLQTDDGRIKDILEATAAGTEESGPRIVELGAGTGLLSIIFAALAKHRCSSIVATDLGDALSLLERNIAQNRHLFPLGTKVDAAELDWEQASSHPIVSDSRGCDLILVSDCTYNPAYFSALGQAIAALLAQPTPRSVVPTCLLAKKHRHADEDALWPAFAEHQLQATLVHGSDPIVPQADANSHARLGWGMYRIMLQHTQTNLSS